MKRDGVLSKAGDIVQVISVCLAGTIFANHSFTGGSTSWSDIPDLFKLPDLNTKIIIILIVNMLVVVLDLHLVHFFGECRSVFNLIRGHVEVIFYWQLPADQTNEFSKQLREAEISVRSDFLQMIPAVLTEEIVFRATLILVWRDFGSTFGVFFLFLQAILFSATHLDSGMQKASFIRFFIFAPILALLWGILAISSGSIILGGVIHLFTNSVAMATDWILYKLARKRMNEDVAS